MRPIITCILLCLTFLASYSQQLRPLSLEPTSDLPNGKLSRVDVNNTPAAIVKVKLPVDGVKFDGNLIGEPMFDVNQYYVWLEGYRDGVSPGTRFFDIQCPGTETVRVTFSEISDITLLSPGVIYELRMEVPQFLLGRASSPADTGGNYFVMKVTPPANVWVRVDGQPAEVDNGEVMMFCRYGEHTYSVEAPGYVSQNGSFSIDRGGDKVVREVALKSSKASVTITAATPGTEIILNGQSKGKGSWSGSLGAGSYRLEASLTGHEPWLGTFDLRESESRTVEIPALTPIYARLDVTSKPSGAAIAIDGKQAGTTPQAFNNLLEGTHQVTVSSPGYRTLTKTVKLSAAEPAVVSEPLAKAVSEVSTAQHLSLCVVKDGQISYLNERQWMMMSGYEQEQYEKKGVVINDGANSFVVAMRDAGKHDWGYARSHGAPTIGQLKVIYKYLDPLNNALNTFGGKELEYYVTGSPVYWSSSEKSPGIGLNLSMSNGIEYGSRTADEYNVRLIVPIK